MRQKKAIEGFVEIFGKKYSCVSYHTRRMRSLYGFLYTTALKLKAAGIDHVSDRNVLVYFLRKEDGREDLVWAFEHFEGSHVRGDITRLLPFLKSLARLSEEGDVSIDLLDAFWEKCLVCCPNWRMSDVYTLRKE